MSRAGQRLLTGRVYRLVNHVGRHGAIYTPASTLLPTTAIGLATLSDSSADERSACRPDLRNSRGGLKGAIAFLGITKRAGLLNLALDQDR
jgi:hypothetical protein